MSIAEMQRNKWKRSLEGLCTGMPFHRVQMSASKASVGNFFGPLNVQPFADLNAPGEHQGQVKVLIERTASSLDDTTLKKLFVSVQQNNIELCIQCAIEEYVMISFC